MPLLKGKGCKSRPNAIIKYITDERKAGIVSSFYLDDSRNYAEQFRKTADIFGKCKRFNERKYYHFIHSFNPADNISPQDAHRMTEEFVQKAFPDNEAVIATHTDTDTVHCHVVLNAIDFVEGRKIHLTNKEYARLKDLSNEISIKYGYSALDWRNPAQKHKTTAEHNIIISGGTSWKEQLREVIDEALKSACNMEQFEKFLKQFNITLSRNTEKTISFLHPEKNKPIRGEKLGQSYTKGEILNAVTENYKRTYSTAIIAESADGAIASIDRNAVQPIRERTFETEAGGLFGEVSSASARDDNSSQQPAEADRETSNRTQPQRKKHSRGC